MGSGSDHLDGWIDGRKARSRFRHPDFLLSKEAIKGVSPSLPPFSALFLSGAREEVRVDRCKEAGFGFLALHGMLEAHLSTPRRPALASLAPTDGRVDERNGAWQYSKWLLCALCLVSSPSPSLGGGTSCFLRVLLD